MCIGWGSTCGGTSLARIPLARIFAYVGSEMAAFVVQSHVIFHMQPMHANELQQADMALDSSLKML